MTKENLSEDLEDEIDDDGPDDENEDEAEGGETDPPEKTDTVEGGEQDAATGEDDEEKLAKSERRKRERKARKERDRREREELREAVLQAKAEAKAAREEAAAVKGSLTQSDAVRLDNEMAEVDRIHQQAVAAMQEAISEGDGAKFANAQSIKDKAFAKYGALLNQKQSLKPTATAEKPANVTTDTAPNPRMIKRANDWAAKNTWFSPDTEDGQIADVVGERLLKEGYDPADQDYWEELDDRLRSRLPHRYRTKAKSNGSPPVGGSGRDTSSNSKSEPRLPKEFVKTLDDAFGDDQPKRQAAIKNYLSSQKGAR